MGTQKHGRTQGAMEAAAPLPPKFFFENFFPSVPQREFLKLF